MSLLPHLLLALALLATCWACSPPYYTSPVISRVSPTSDPNLLLVTIANGTASELSKDFIFDISAQQLREKTAADPEAIAPATIGLSQLNQTGISFTTNTEHRSFVDVVVSEGGKELFTIPFNLLEVPDMEGNDFHVLQREENFFITYRNATGSTWVRVLNSTGGFIRDLNLDVYDTNFAEQVVIYAEGIIAIPVQCCLCYSHDYFALLENAPFFLRFEQPLFFDNRTGEAVIGGTFYPHSIGLVDWEESGEPDSVSWTPEELAAFLFDTDSSSSSSSIAPSSSESASSSSEGNSASIVASTTSGSPALGCGLFLLTALALIA